MAEQAYFDGFPHFEPDPLAAALANFDRLAISQNWRQGRKKYKAEKDIYLSALATNHIASIESGGAAERLAGLQELCAEVGIELVPETITRCKKELKKVNVCIMCLIEHRRLGTPLHAFRAQAELRAHVKTAGDFYPKDKAKREGSGLLKLLLRIIR